MRLFTRLFSKKKTTEISKKYEQPSSDCIAEEEIPESELEAKYPPGFAIKTYEDLVAVAIDRLRISNKNTGANIVIPVFNTKNGAVLNFEPGGMEWAYSVGIVKEGTDKMVSNYLNCGSKREVMAYLKSEEAVTQTLDAIRRLSVDADADWHEPY